MSQQYYPFGPAPPQQEPERQQYAQPQPQAVRIPSVKCDFCDKLIHCYEEAVELLHGPVQISQRNGQLMVMPDEKKEVAFLDRPAILHPWCVAGFCYTKVCDTQDWDSPEVDITDQCPSCGYPLDGDFREFE